MSQFSSDTSIAGVSCSSFLLAIIMVSDLMRCSKLCSW